MARCECSTIWHELFDVGIESSLMSGDGIGRCVPPLPEAQPGWASASSSCPNPPGRELDATILVVCFRRSRRLVREAGRAGVHTDEAGIGGRPGTVLPLGDLRH